VSVEGEKCVKVSVSLPSDVVPLRDSLGCPTFEADIPYRRKYTIVTGETYSPSPDVLFYDVEASVEEGFPKPENPRGRGRNRLSRDVSPFARYHSPHIEYYLKKEVLG